MRTAILTLPVLSTILACGPGAPGDTDTDPTTAGTSGETGPGTSSDASTTAEPATTDALPTTATTVASETSPTTPTSATTDALPTTGVETTDGETTDATTGPVETATADPSTTTTTGETDGAPDVAFAAQFWAGGLDHIILRMAAIKDDFCVELRFARPGDGPDPQPTLPPDWWHQGATVSQGAADCLDFMAPLPAGVFSTSITGFAAWTTDPFCPPTLDEFDLQIDFPPDQPWVPAQVQVLGGGVAVAGC